MDPIVSVPEFTYLTALQSSKAIFTVSDKLIHDVALDNGQNIYDIRAV